MAKTLVGIVSSDRTDKTIVVTVVTRKTHPLYRKQYTSSTKFMAHDEKNEAKTGDKVQIAETRPLSARKRHVLDKVLERPILREGIAGDVEIPMTEKKAIEKKEKSVVEALDETPEEVKEEKPAKKTTATKKPTAKKADKKEETKGDDK